MGNGRTPKAKLGSVVHSLYMPSRADTFCGDSCEDGGGEEREGIWATKGCGALKNLTPQQFYGAFWVKARSSSRWTFRIWVEPAVIAASVKIGAADPQAV